MGMPAAWKEFLKFRIPLPVRTSCWLTQLRQIKAQLWQFQNWQAQILDMLLGLIGTASLSVETL